MKIDEIKEALGIGSIVKEEECTFMKSTYDWYERLRDNEHLIKYFNSIQGGSYLTAMRKYKYVYSFFSRGNEMIFYELYRVKEEITIKEAINRKLFPVEEFRQKIDQLENEQAPYFIIEKIQTPGQLEKKLVVNNIRGQVTHIKYEKFSQFDILAIEKIKTATDFTDYNNVHLTYNELQQVVQDEKWKDMLSRYGGIYLIHDNYTGKNYIGSAYNKRGILGRWENYVNNPTGGDDESGNQKLVELLNKGMNGNDTKLKGKEYAEKYFMYSILEILPLTIRNKKAHQIIEAEQRWKKILGTLGEKSGLNAN